MVDNVSKVKLFKGLSLCLVKFASIMFLFNNLSNEKIMNPYNTLEFSDCFVEEVKVES